MDHDFWQEKWANNQTAFHEPEANALLTAHFDQLSLPPDSRVFVPLCGKTLDLDWLVQRGHEVVGIELNRPAVEAVFERLGLVPQTTQKGKLVRLKARAVEIFVGDFFELSREQLGPVAAVYDRAALIALPSDMRRSYAQHLHLLSGEAPQLLISLNYDQSKMEGPPFSVPADEIEQLYGARYRKRLLSSRPARGPLGEQSKAMWETWLLTPAGKQAVAV